MDAADRLARLKQARAAAVAVRDEMNRRNDSNPMAENVRKRAPILRAAEAEITDLDLLINDIQDTPAPITLDADTVAQLDALAERLDRAIVSDGLVGLALESVTRALDASTQVRGILA